MLKKLLLLASTFLACQSSVYALTILDGFELGVTNVKSYVNAKRQVCKVDDLEGFYSLAGDCYGITSLTDVGINKQTGTVLLIFDPSVTQMVLQSLIDKYGPAYKKDPDGTQSWIQPDGLIYFTPPKNQEPDAELTVTYIPMTELQKEAKKLKSIL